MMSQLRTVSARVQRGERRRHDRKEEHQSSTQLWVLASATYLLLVLLLFHKALFSGHSAVGVGGDPYIFQWHLAWVAHALSHGTNPLFSRYISTSNGGENLMYYTSLPLAGLLAWPVTALGGPVLSYNVVMVVSVVTSAVAAYAMCARFVSWKPAAFLGGLVYGFSPYMAAQSLGHPHLTMAWFPPVVVIVADIVARGRRQPVSLGVLFGIAVTAQLLLGTEILLTSVLLAILGAIIWVVLFPREEGTTNLWRHGLPTLAVATATVAVLGSFPLYMLVFGGHGVGIHSPLQPRDVYVNDVTGFFVPGRIQLVSTTGSRSHVAHFSGNYVEATAYVGAPLLLLLVFFLWKRWADRTVRLAVIGAVICAVLSLGPRLHVNGAAGFRLPASILDRIPVLWNILPSRLMLYGYLAIALALAAIIDRGRPDRRRLRLLGVGLCVAFLFPVSLPALHEVTPLAFRSVARRGGAVLVTPAPTSLAQMYWQADTEFSVRLIGGFTLAARPRNALLDAIETGDSTGEWSRPTAEQADALRRSALQLGATVIIDVPDPDETQRRAFLAFLFGPSETSPDGFAVWHLPTRPNHDASSPQASASVALEGSR
jgi:hypothetical protein